MIKILDEKQDIVDGHSYLVLQTPDGELSVHAEQKSTMLKLGRVYTLERDLVIDRDLAERVTTWLAGRKVSPLVG